MAVTNEIEIKTLNANNLEKDNVEVVFIDGTNTVTNNEPAVIIPTNANTVQISNGENNATTPKNIEDKMVDGSINFKVLYVVTLLSGLTMLVLVGCWIGVHMGGLGWTSEPRKEFYWHPLLMSIGLIFLYGNSILVYRAFRNVRKKTVKIAHAAIHMGAFILVVIALKTVFDSHNLVNPPIPNMYSLHSWLGMAAVIIFGLQYVFGFLAYLTPAFQDKYKIALMPYHVYFGLFGFGLSIASALTGLNEKAIFSISNYSQLPTAGVFVNVIGILYVVFGGLVLYLATEPSYKRKPIPEDSALLPRSNE